MTPAAALTDERNGTTIKPSGTTPAIAGTSPKEGN